MAELKIELISIGDEILLGHTLDTNANWIAGILSENGFRLRRHTTVRDQESDILMVLSDVWERSDITLVTGGLGPTPDDITRPAVAKFFSDRLKRRDDLLRKIVERFESRGLRPLPGHESMALFPSGAKAISNEHGSAPGIHYSVEGRHLIALPGVPMEMKGMVNSYILPHLQKNRKGSFLHHIFRTTGVGESTLSKMIGEITDLYPVSIAYLPSIDTGVAIRLSVSGVDTETIESKMEKAKEHIRSTIGKYVFSEANESLTAVLLAMLEKDNKKIAIAESCTGGMICDRFTSVPGSSRVFERGYISYSNESKVELLGVDEELIARFGAVSEQVAAAMAAGARIRADVDYALSVTGIAGPTGNTEDKPLGLTYIGLADRNQTVVKRYHFAGNRDANRRRSTAAALTLIWNKLLKEKI